MVGKGSPYISFAFLYVISFKIFSDPGITGVYVPLGIGITFSIISDILFGLVTTISYAVSLSK